VFHFHPVIDDDDQLIHVVMEGWDVTEQEDILKSYEESQARFSRLTEDILDSTPTAIWILDEDLNVIWVNAKTEEYFGVDRPELIGKTRDELVAFLKERGDGQNGFHETLITAYENGTAVSDQMLVLRAAEGENKRWLEYSSQPISRGIYEGGRIEHYQDVTKLKSIQKNLVQAVDEKNTLLKEVHHRVKNNLQIITSLLSMQSDQFDDKDLKKALDESINRTKAMAMIHEQLYQTEHFDRVDFKTYIDNVIEHLLESYSASETVDLTLEIEPIDLPLSAAIASGLIVNELVSNSLEHAVGTTGDNRIAVTFHELDDRTLRLQVTDHGDGITENFEIEASDTMGFKVVKSLTEYELDGSLSWKREDGFRVMVDFPKSLTE
jgi:PAS domain S-box-containing protein